MEISAFPGHFSNFHAELRHLRYSVISPISQCADSCEHVHNSVLLKTLLLLNYFHTGNFCAAGVKSGTVANIFCHLLSAWKCYDQPTCVFNIFCFKWVLCINFYTVFTGELLCMFLTALHFLCEKSVFLVLVARLLLFRIYVSPDLN
jgi:hypothetical protein